MQLLITSAGVLWHEVITTTPVSDYMMVIQLQNNNIKSNFQDT